MSRVNTADDLGAAFATLADICLSILIVALVAQPLKRRLAPFTKSGCSALRCLLAFRFVRRLSYQHGVLLSLPMHTPTVLSPLGQGEHALAWLDSDYHKQKGSFVAQARAFECRERLTRWTR